MPPLGIERKRIRPAGRRDVLNHPSKRGKDRTSASGAREKHPVAAVPTTVVELLRTEPGLRYQPSLTSMDTPYSIPSGDH